MRFIRALPISVFGLAACGGGDLATNPGSGPPYDFIAPVLNQTRSYSEAVVDNSGNSIIIGFTDTITALNADGSATQLSQSSTGSSSVLDGTNYAVTTEIQSYDGEGQETSYLYTAADGTATTCTFNPHGTGPDWPVKVGETWSLEYVFACGTNTPVTYRQTGEIVDVETITVPAGTFSALKLQSAVTWTDAAGTTRTQTVTNWRDIFTSYSVKSDITIAVSGTAPATGYAVSRTDVLESIS